MARRILIMLLLFVLLITGCSLSTSNDLQTNQVESMTLQGPCMANGCQMSQSFNPSESNDKLVISKVLNWLNSAQKDRTLNGVPTMMGGSPRMLQIKFRGGNNLSIVAVGPNEVDVMHLYHVETEVKVAPELSNWISVNWKQDVPQNK